jgi:prepilin-type N-terminal cleavage/methylation domain-containing protein
MSITPKFTPRRPRRDAGFTLVELLVTLMMLAAVGGICGLALSVFARSLPAVRPAAEDQAFQSIHLYLENQLGASTAVIIKDGRVYLNDPETPAYYNYYTRSAGDLLMRHKVDARLQGIGGGETSQFAARVRDFALTPSFAGGRPTGRFHLRVQFTDQNEAYETDLHFPGDPAQIQCP